jgi:hypothetical protein
MTPGVSQPGTSKAVERGPINSSEKRLEKRGLDRPASRSEILGGHGARTSANKLVNPGSSLFPLSIALPSLDCLDAEPPVATNAKSRQPSLSEHPIDCGLVDAQIFGQFGDVQDLDFRVRLRFHCEMNLEPPSSELDFENPREVARSGAGQR